MGIVTLPYRPGEGDPEDIAQLMADFDAVLAAVNGGLDAANFAAGKIFDLTKLMQGAAALSDVLVWNGTNWVPSKIADAHISASAAISPSKIAGGIGVSKLADTTLAASTATVTFTGLPGTHAHLLFVYSAGGVGMGRQNLNLRFNNDIANVYGRQTIRALNTGLTASSAGGTSQIAFVESLMENSGGEGSGGFAFVPHYASAKEKLVLGLTGCDEDGTNQNLVCTFGAWTRTPAAAITRVDLWASGGDLAAGSRFTIYGLGS